MAFLLHVREFILILYRVCVRNIVINQWIFTFRSIKVSITSDTYKNMSNRFAIIVIFEHHIIYPEITMIDYIEFIFGRFAGVYSYLIQVVVEFTNFFCVSGDQNGTNIRSTFFLNILNNAICTCIYVLHYFSCVIT